MKQNITFMETQQNPANDEDVVSYSPRMKSLIEEIQPLKDKLINHPVYHEIDTLEHLQKFMRLHIYAVWDFMSLLKALQTKLTCIDVPWVPEGDSNIRYLINEIVVGEESDVDAYGNRISHYELYLQAMEQAGMDTNEIKDFVREVRSHGKISEIIQNANIPNAAKDFMNNTFAVIATGAPHIIAPVFTFGREDLIPVMFEEIIKELKQDFPDELGILHYYIERHIEVDGGHHSLLAYQMTELCCENDPKKWREATSAVKRSLQHRLGLWNAIHASISNN